MKRRNAAALVMALLLGFALLVPSASVLADKTHPPIAESIALPAPAGK